MTGVFLRKFTEKINISVSINSDGIVAVKKDDENYSYNNFRMFYNDLREYYINMINNANAVSKKAICFDAIQSFYTYQDIFGVYCDRIEVVNECEYHTKYFQNQYYLYSKLDELNIVDKGSTYPTIFKSDLYLEKFKSILNNLNAFDKEGKPIKRGFIAKANAIFEFEKRLEEKNFHKKIMMSNITIKEFVEFLNLEFNLGIKYHPNYKLSSGEKHETAVKRFY